MSPPLSIDVLLNLLWCAICAGCVALLVASERGRSRSFSAKARSLVAVVAIALVLFPCVSVTDDEAVLCFLNSHGARGGIGIPLDDRERNESVARVFDTIQTFQISAIWSLLLTAAFISLVLLPSFRIRERCALSRFGRSPPILV